MTCSRVVDTVELVGLLFDSKHRSTHRPAGLGMRAVGPRSCLEAAALHALVLRNRKVQFVGRPCQRPGCSLSGRLWSPDAWNDTMAMSCPGCGDPGTSMRIKLTWPCGVCLMLVMPHMRLGCCVLSRRCRQSASEIERVRSPEQVQGWLHACCNPDFQTAFQTWWKSAPAPAMPSSQSHPGSLGNLVCTAGGAGADLAGKLCERIVLCNIAAMERVSLSCSDSLCVSCTLRHPSHSRRQHCPCPSAPGSVWGG